MILSVGCPENSIAAIWILNDLNTGITEREINIIPIPPSHWVRLLQKRIPCGIDSISVRIVPPVVVKPDIDSKKASPKLFIEPLKRKGRCSKKAENQPDPCNNNVSFLIAVNSFFIP